MANSTNGSAAAKRFELPALDFKFTSLTEGTDIPPPLPSPKEEPAPKPVPKSGPKTAPVPPKTPTKEQPALVQEAKSENANGHLNGSETSPTPGPINAGIKRPAEDGPASPAGSSRGSLRRLLSKTLLNNTYNEQASISGQSLSRPPSRTASTITDDRKAKRGSGWFRRLRSSDSSAKRSSRQFEEVKKPAGPPPPMIPELSALETKVDTRIGDDLFKGIK